MQPVPQDLRIYQGDTYDFFFRLRERVWDEAAGDYVPGDYINLTDWTGKSQIRTAVTAADPMAEFDVVFTDQALIPGGVLLKLDKDTTSGLTGNGVWDVELIDNVGERRTYIAGKVIVTPQVTR